MTAASTNRPDPSNRLAAVVARLIGVAHERVEALRQDASNRRYHRVWLSGWRAPTLVVMELADDPLKSEEATATGAAAPKELPFLNVQRFLAGRGVPVPTVYAADVPGRVVLLEDLGDRTLEVAIGDGGDAERLYGDAVDLLCDMQRRCAEPDPSCIAFSRAFDAPLLRWELDHFREWGLDARGVSLGPAERAALDAAFARIVDELSTAPRTFVHRDFQSRNLMVLDGRLRLIDFQDALLGTRVYDLVALLCDSYVDLGEPLRERLRARFADGVGIAPADRPAFLRLFDLQTVQRKLKDAGRFVYIERVKKNPSFLPYVAPSLAHVRRALARLPDLAGLSRVVSV